VRRSATLRYVTAVSAFTCSRMRPDGFGGMAVLITADAVIGKSTNDIIGDFLNEAGLDAGA
jgi:galactokinase